jgi:hypothetical protein
LLVFYIILELLRRTMGAVANGDCLLKLSTGEPISWGGVEGSGAVGLLSMFFTHPVVFSGIENRVQVNGLIGIDFL